MKRLLQNIAMVAVAGMVGIASASAGEIDVKKLTCPQFVKLNDIQAAMAISEADGYLIGTRGEGNLGVPDDEATLAMGLKMVREICSSHADTTLLELMQTMHEGAK